MTRGQESALAAVFCSGVPPNAKSRPVIGCTAWVMLNVNPGTGGPDPSSLEPVGAGVSSAS